MFFESSLKYKGISQEMGIAESLKYQKYKSRDFTRISFWFAERLSQSSKESLQHPPHLNQRNTFEIGKIMHPHTHTKKKSLPP